jgi:glyceraldehyde-3-phosphate dehydrogenase (NAD(P))
MSVTGVSDVVTDWRAHMISRSGFRLFGATHGAAQAMRDVGLEVAGTLDDLFGEVDVVVDCTRPCELPPRTSIRTNFER